MSLTIWIYLHLFSRCCLRNLQTYAKFQEIRTYSSLRSSKVIDLGVGQLKAYMQFSISH